MLHLDGLPIRLIDTAGLRVGADAVERIGVDRARKAVAGADVVLHLVDDREPDPSAEMAPEVSPAQERIPVRNKVDLSGSPPGLDERVNPPAVRISARTGAGLSALRARLKALAGYRSGEDGVFIARRRHVEALKEALAALSQGRAQLAGCAAGELLAEGPRAGAARTRPDSRARSPATSCWRGYSRASVSASDAPGAGHWAGQGQVRARHPVRGLRAGGRSPSRT